jgi:magnesium transporter
LVSGLFDIHFSVVANKTNDILKFLSIFSAIWLPLSFIAGVYGMNFENMPELKTQFGYYITLSVMLFVAAALIVYFWRKGWIFQRDTEEAKVEIERETTSQRD